MWDTSEGRKGDRLLPEGWKLNKTSLEAWKGDESLLKGWKGEVTLPEGWNVVRSFRRDGRTNVGPFTGLQVRLQGYLHFSLMLGQYAMGVGVPLGFTAVFEPEY